MVVNTSAIPRFRGVTGRPPGRSLGTTAARAVSSANSSTSHQESAGHHHGRGRVHRHAEPVEGRVVALPDHGLDVEHRAREVQELDQRQLPPAGQGAGGAGVVRHDGDQPAGEHRGQAGQQVPLVPGRGRPEPDRERDREGGDPPDQVGAHQRDHQPEPGGEQSVEPDRREPLGPASRLQPQAGGREGEVAREPEGGQRQVHPGRPTGDDAHQEGRGEHRPRPVLLRHPPGSAPARDDGRAHGPRLCDPPPPIEQPVG